MPYDYHRPRIQPATEKAGFAEANDALKSRYFMTRFLSSPTRLPLIDCLVKNTDANSASSHSLSNRPNPKNFRLSYLRTLLHSAAPLISLISACVSLALRLSALALLPPHLPCPLTRHTCRERISVPMVSVPLAGCQMHYDLHVIAALVRRDCDAGPCCHDLPYKVSTDESHRM